ncbi:MAG: GNAT family N-acetyltransferase [Geitlerinemataceae cyanobacterium]
MSLFYRVKEIESSDFQAAIEIYEKAFPDRERVTISSLVDRIRSNTYQVFVKKEDNRVIFMAVLCKPILEEFVLLGYLATHPDFRNRGLGTLFVNDTLEKLRSRSQYLLLEVEDPHIGFDTELKQRRVNFYRRLGAKQLKNVRYILPPLSGGESTEMILMLAPQYPANRILGERVKQLITQLYLTFYDRQIDDPLLRSIWQTIGESVELI